ncbi:MAG: hypothetical protein MZW92_43750 [Comamonadaceae bacterium]|nr:hypothetical protein [Comamonadaceae bacterium]
MIEFAVPHTLAFTLLPALADGACARPSARSRRRLIALNVHDAVLRLTEGGCDLLIAYHHASPAAAAQTPSATRCSSWASETLAPLCQGRTPTASRCSSLPGRGRRSRVPLPGLCAGGLPGRSWST